MTVFTADVSGIIAFYNLSWIANAVFFFIK